MGSLSSKNWDAKDLLRVIDNFTKYACEKKAKNVFYGFIKTVIESKHKPNKLWVGQGRVLYNKLL